jgi:molybdopterin converting factor small subunit
VAEVRLFGPVRVAAGTGREQVDAHSVEELLAALKIRHGSGFEAILATCAVYVNGEPAATDTRLADGDEVALLPPVSGGA